MPFSRLAFKKAVRGIRKRATGFVLLAVLFLAVGFLQDIFVSNQIRKTTRLELNESANEIVGEIYKNDKWDLRNYRQAFFSVSSWYVFTADGLLIDNEAPITNLLQLFHSVEYPTNLNFGTPQTITSEIGGKYRLLGRGVRGGVIIVGSDTDESTNNQCAECVDQRLTLDLAKFGSTLESAAAITSREVNPNTSFAVLSDTGKLLSGLGEVPLKIDPTAMLATAKSGKPTNIANQIYFFVSQPILDSKNKIVGTVLIPGDITLQQRTVNEQWKFNLALSAVAFAIAAVIAVYFIGRELVRNPHFENLPEALQTPESLKKEIKSSFQWDISRNSKNLDERMKTLKTIVAFLNSEGGVLFIGVNDNLTVRGIKEDLELFNGSTDKFLLHLMELISNRIGAEFSPLIKARCESIGGKIVCAIDVEKATQPAFLKDEGKSHFYIREGPRTNELDSKESNAFIRSKRWDE